MILKGSQRAGAGALARHLLRTDENEHVTVKELRGFTADNLRDALVEAEAIAKGTRCKQYLFSLSLNPPKDGNASPEDLIAAADEAEKRLGLTGCPRVIVEHEKNGRRHAHAVWSRIDPNTLKAVNLPFFKTRLAELSKDLYLQHGWELPEGHKENGKASPLNYRLAEGQQAKRLGLNPKEVKQLFRDAWQRSGDLTTFRMELAEKGFLLANGDRRRFIALDAHGNAFSISRMLGMSTSKLEGHLGASTQLPSVQTVVAKSSLGKGTHVEATLKQFQRQHRRELTPLRWERRGIVRAQRAERVQMTAARRHATTKGNQQRAMRVKDWADGALKHITNELPFIRKQNANESYDEYQRFRRKMEQKYQQQLDELLMVQRAIDKIRARQQTERLALLARMALVARLQRNNERNAPEVRPHQLTLEL